MLICSSEYSYCYKNIPRYSQVLRTRLVVTILAPTPMLAANFILLGHIVPRLGTSYSRIAPRLCELLLPGNIIQISSGAFLDGIIFCIGVCRSRIYWAAVIHIEFMIGCCHIGCTGCRWRPCGIGHNYISNNHGKYLVLWFSTSRSGSWLLHKGWVYHASRHCFAAR
jgi:hypothetical protein